MNPLGRCWVWLLGNRDDGHAMALGLCCPFLVDIGADDQGRYGFSDNYAEDPGPFHGAAQVVVPRGDADLSQGVERGASGPASPVKMRSASQRSS